MSELSEKIILTDVDGVLLDWDASFELWMKHRNLIKKDSSTYSISESYKITKKQSYALMEEFAHSKHFRNLLPFKDAVHYVDKIYREFGIKFHVITAVSNEDPVRSSRIKNLHKTFGKHVFYDITCVGYHQSKFDVLSKYRDTGCIWIDDFHPHYKDGETLGLTSLMMSHHHNSHHTGVCRVNDFKGVYNILSN